VRHNVLVILIGILLIGRASPIFAEFNINSTDPIVNPDYVNPDKLKSILPESVQNLIEGAENIGIDVVKQGVDIATGEKSLDINPNWWQNIKDTAGKIWNKINTVVDVDSFFLKAKDVVISLVQTLWEFIRGIFTDNRIISQPRA
jgi:hypothetical protein